MDHIGSRSSAEADDDPMNEIVPHVFVGGIESLDHLDEYDIYAVITVIHRKRIVEEALSARLGPNRPHMRIYIRDDKDEPINFYFDDAADFIHRYRAQGKNVLVHCMAGMSRSATLVLYYMMKYLGYNYRSAMTKAKEARPIIHPNSGFRAHLKKICNKV